MTAFDVIDGRVQGVRQGVNFGDTMFLDCFVINRPLLLDMFDWYAPTDYLDLFEAMAGDFGRVDVRTYDFDGYVAPIFNKRAYFRANMDLLDPRITGELFVEERFIKTKTHDTPPPSSRSAATCATPPSPPATASTATSATPSWAATSSSRPAPRCATPS